MKHILLTLLLLTSLNLSAHDSILSAELDLRSKALWKVDSTFGKIMSGSIEINETQKTITFKYDSTQVCDNPELACTLGISHHQVTLPISSVSVGHDNVVTYTAIRTKGDFSHDEIEEKIIVRDYTNSSPDFKLDSAQPIELPVYPKPDDFIPMVSVHYSFTAKIHPGHQQFRIQAKVLAEELQ